MLFLSLLSLATYLVVSYSAPINCDIPDIVSPLSDVTTSVGSRVSLECRLGVLLAEDEYLNGLVTWSVDGKVEKSNVKEDGRLVIGNSSHTECCISSLFSKQYSTGTTVFDHHRNRHANSIKVGLFIREYILKL